MSRTTITVSALACDLCGAVEQENSDDAEFWQKEHVESETIDMCPKCWDSIDDRIDDGDSRSFNEIAHELLRKRRNGNNDWN